MPAIFFWGVIAFASPPDPEPTDSTQASNPQEAELKSLSLELQSLLRSLKDGTDICVSVGTLNGTIKGTTLALEHFIVVLTNAIESNNLDSMRGVIGDIQEALHNSFSD